MTFNNHSNHSNILVIGGGTWACSIALELASRGYKDIKVLDQCSFPSAVAAGNDLNKIAEEANEPSQHDSDEDYFWNTVHRISMDAWKNNSLLKGLYYPTGFIMAAVSDPAYDHCLKYAESEQARLVRLENKQDFHATMPEGVLTGEFPGWRGFWKDGKAGWVFASAALKAMHNEAVRLGVKFLSGDLEGKVEELTYSDVKDDIVGARTADGLKHTADQTILAAGANSDLLLDFRKQLRPTAWTLAHLPLTAEEAERYRNLPVLYGVDKGFFIEPDAKNHEMKICDEHPGYLNPVEVDGELRSIPFAREQIPKEAESRMRQLLRETMPHFADRNFSFARIFWDADTVDRVFLIDKHPEMKGLMLAVGGSGHGFMTCPAIGRLVVDTLEGKVEERLRRMMRWRPEISDGRDWWDTQDRFGGNGKVMDFQEVKEWTHIGERQD